MTDAASLSFQHRFEPGTRGRPLLLLHGTGGSEADLLPLGRELAPAAARLSPRGQVLERGMPRFFSRIGEGVFDLDEVRGRADDLAAFVTDARAYYGLDAPIALGFSNGANIAAALMIRRPDVLAGAILLRPMPVLDDAAAGLAGRPVLILSGARDPLVTPDVVGRLADQLRHGGATVEHHVLQTAGHNIDPADLRFAKAWLAANG